MPRKLQLFHQLYEKKAETFLADFHQDRLYNIQPQQIRVVLSIRKHKVHHPHHFVGIILIILIQTFTASVK